MYQYLFIENQVYLFPKFFFTQSQMRLQCLSKVTMLILFFFSGCDARTDVEGVVAEKSKDSTVAPIEGAKVVLIELNTDGSFSDYKDASVTDSDGKYYVAMTHAPVESTFSLIVTKEGYLDFTTKVHSQVDGHVLDITMSAVGCVKPLRNAP